MINIYRNMYITIIAIIGLTPNDGWGIKVVGYTVGKIGYRATSSLQKIGKSIKSVNKTSGKE